MASQCGVWGPHCERLVIPDFKWMFSPIEVLYSRVPRDSNDERREMDRLVREPQPNNRHILLSFDPELANKMHAQVHSVVMNG